LAGRNKLASTGEPVDRVDKRLSRLTSSGCPARKYFQLYIAVARF
jgi:hypothetical protein